MSNVRFNRAGSVPPIVKNLIAINVVVFIAQLVFEDRYHLTDKFALHPVIPGALREILNGYYRDFSEVTEFSPYQVFTHMFTHSPTFFFHILFNMLVLFVFGRVLESVWGSKRFLT